MTKRKLYFSKVKKLSFLILFFISVLQLQAVDKFPGDSINSEILEKKLSVDDFIKETRSLRHTDSKNYRDLIHELLNYAQNTNNRLLEGKSYHYFSAYFENNLQMDSSLICMRKARTIQIEIGDSAGLISTYFSFGNRFDVKGIADSAIHYYYKALGVSEKTNDSINIGYALMGVGNIQSANKQVVAAKGTYNQSLIFFEATSEIAMSWIYNNLGTIYANEDSLDMAIGYYQKSLEIKERHDDWYGILFTNNNIGDMIIKQGNDPEKALVYFLTSLKMGKEFGVEKEQLGNSYLKAGNSYLLMTKYDLALNYQDSSIQIGSDLNSFKLLSKNYLLQSKIYTAQKKYKMANEALSQYVLYNDSLLNEQSLNQVNQLSAKYENEKKELEISNLEKDKKAQQAQIKQKEAENLMYLVGLGLAILLTVFVSLAFLQKRKANFLIKSQKDEIEIQKEIVDEKNREILDSIAYAKRIQLAILPPKRVVKNYLPDSFILYLPKDIVSGDFYWMEEAGDNVLFAAVDCTGHGVPGAMVSVICHNALNQSVKEFGLTDPNLILDKTRELVIAAFSASDEDVKDGMDIALCSLNTRTNLLHFSGANNPLWVIRKGASSIEEIKADKQPVGKFELATPFTNNVVQLDKGDAIYIFSDGYADQFGGPKGKKIMRKQFKQILLDAVEKDAAQQQNILLQNFNNWKGNLEQIDDVCVIGVKL